MIKTTTNTFQMHVSAEEQFLLKSMRERERKFESKQIHDAYQSGVIDGYYLYKEFLTQDNDGEMPLPQV